MRLNWLCSILPKNEFDCKNLLNDIQELLIVSKLCRYGATSTWQYKDPTFGTREWLSGLDSIPKIKWENSGKKNT